MTAAKTRRGAAPAKGSSAKSVPAKAASKRPPAKQPVAKAAAAKAPARKPAPTASRPAVAKPAVAKPASKPVAATKPVSTRVAVPTKPVAGKAAVAAKPLAAKAAPAKATGGRKGRGDAGSEANLHKRVDSERIAEHIAAFEKSGGRVEKLGVTKVLQRASELAASAPAQASKTGGRRR